MEQHTKSHVTGFVILLQLTKYKENVAVKNIEYIEYLLKPRPYGDDFLVKPEPAISETTLGGGFRAIRIYAVSHTARRLDALHFFRGEPAP